MAQVEYLKGYLSVADQVELLRARGMRISDEDRAAVCLHRVGYYRLSGYAYPFRHREIVTDSNGQPVERVFENFRPGTEFSQVMDLYVFDKRLRLLFLDAIERVEVGLRVEVALLLGQKGPFCYRDQATFNSYFSTPDQLTNETPHARLIARLDESFGRSREEFAEHFKKKYSSVLPIWMSIELWDFGTLVNILHGMKSGDLDRLAGLYGLAKRNFLPSWAQSINFVRNVCAHHGRLWNRPLVQQPSPGRLGDVLFFDHMVVDAHAQRRPYAVAAVLQYLMRYIHPGSTWSTRLKEHLRTFPISAHVSVRHMGFPEGWERLELWIQ